MVASSFQRAFTGIFCKEKFQIKENFSNFKRTDALIYKRPPKSVRHPITATFSLHILCSCCFPKCIIILYYYYFSSENEEKSKKHTSFVQKII